MSFQRLVDYIVYIIVRIIVFVLITIPEEWAYAFGRAMGRIAFVFSADRRSATIENLTIAFQKEQDRNWILQTARKSFEHLGLLVVEFFRIRAWSLSEMHDRLEIIGKENFNLMTLPGDHGILLLNSHFGCFEVSAATTKYLGINTHLIATGLKNPFLSQYVFTRAGKHSNVFTYPHKGSVRTLIDLMRNGCLVACLADQRGDAERGIFVDFFGTPAPANEVFAKMAIEANARILPLCTYRTAPGRYKSVYEKEITFELTGDSKTDLTNVSQLFHNQFEKWLRLNPEQGFWVHRKWKRAPSRKRRGVRGALRRLMKS